MTFLIKAEVPTIVVLEPIVAKHGMRNVVESLSTMAHCEGGRFLAMGDNHTAAEWTMVGLMLNKMADDMEGLE
jgi:hypothetical protein